MVILDLISRAQLVFQYNKHTTIVKCRSQWPRGLRSRSASALPLRVWVRIPPGGGHVLLSVVSVVCCQVEGSATGWSLVQRSHRLRCVVVCDLETSWMSRPWPTGGSYAENKQTNVNKSVPNNSSSHCATVTAISYIYVLYFNSNVTKPYKIYICLQFHCGKKHVEFHGDTENCNWLTFNHSCWL
jgi:hypothetical protein